MPSAKSGTAGSPVAPADPTEALDADDADPGVVESTKAEERATKTGKYGTEQTKPFKVEDSAGKPTDNSSDSPPPAKTSWIEIVLVDEEGQPVPGESYEITLPDNTVSSGTLDEKGFARVEGFQPGQCQITFPKLDQDAWEPK